MTRSTANLFRAAYSFYERQLEREVSAGQVPGHIGIIVDGNRRFARRKGIEQPETVYQIGARKLDDVLSWCLQLHVQALTLWVCSTENLQRTPDEVQGMLRAVEDKVRAIAGNPTTHANGIRIRASGRLELLPPSTVDALQSAEAVTRKNSRLILTIAAAYGGREEIVDAVRSLLKEAAKQGRSIDQLVDQLDADDLRRHLYASELPDPDLIIRTSGELRLSGFLLWQSAYSEFYFTDVYWPAFRRIDFLRAIRSYQGRTRRFGI